MIPFSKNLTNPPDLATNSVKYVKRLFELLRRSNWLVVPHFSSPSVSPSKLSRLVKVLKTYSEPLDRSEINLFEAHQLARLNTKRLGCVEAEARSHRRKLLDAHLLKQEPSSRLRQRVKESLGELREPDMAETEALAVVKSDELLEADPLDSTHLLFEELRRISRALREIKTEDLTDKMLMS